MTFNPNEHIIKIKGKDYIEVKWRIVWFRDQHPNGRIDTQLISSQNMIVFCASIYDNDHHMLATGYGSAPSEGKGVWSGRALEKAETAAIGRALAHAGFGTQFTGEDEGDYLADSPITPTQPNSQQLEQSQENGRPADGIKEGEELRGHLLSFEVQNKPGKKPCVLCKVRLEDTERIVPVWTFSRQEFLTQGYMDYDPDSEDENGYWRQDGNGREFIENSPMVTLVAGGRGYFEIKQNSLTHSQLLNKPQNDIPM